jgi:hypothetical protein
MAGESVLTGQTLLAAIAEEAKPFFRTNVVMMALMATKVFRKGTSSLRFNKNGNVTAYVVGEAASITKSTYAQTDVSLTPTKASVYVEPTVEANELGNDPFSDGFAQECGLAIAQAVDTAALALADGFSNSVGTTNTVLTVNVFKDAAYKLELNACPGPYVSVLHPTGIRDIQSDIITSSASVYSAPSMDLAILGGQPAAVNGLKGTIFDIPVFSTKNTKSINAAVDWAGLVFNPRYAIAAGIGERIIPQSSEAPQTGVAQRAFHLLHKFAEWDDLAGVLVTHKQ